MASPFSVCGNFFFCSVDHKSKKNGSPQVFYLKGCEMCNINKEIKMLICDLLMIFYQLFGTNFEKCQIFFFFLFYNFDMYPHWVNVFF